MKKSIVGTFVKADYVTRAITLVGMAAYAGYMGYKEKKEKASKISNNVELRMIPTDWQNVMDAEDRRNIILYPQMDNLSFVAVEKIGKFRNWNDVNGFFNTNYHFCKDIIDMSGGSIEVPEWCNKVIYSELKGYSFVPGDIVIDNNYNIYKVVKKSDPEMEKAYKKLLEESKMSKAPASTANKMAAIKE